MSANTNKIIKNAPHFERRWVFVVSLILVTIGTVAVIASRAATIKGGVLVVSDVNGGFLNGISAIDPANGNIIGSIAAELPVLPGCPVNQNKAYLDDFIALPAIGKVYASLKACAKGAITEGQSIAQFDLKSGKFTGLIAGPGGASRLVELPGKNRLASISGDGLRLWSIDAVTGKTLQQLNLTSSERVTRWGIGGANQLVLMSEVGKIMSLNVDTWTKQDIGLLNGMNFPPASSAPDITRIVAAQGRGFALGVNSNKQWQLIEVRQDGSTATHPVGSQPVSMAPNLGGDHVFIATGCPSNQACVTNPNRLYGYNVEKGEFEAAAGNPFFPLQTSPTQLRFTADGSKMLFDGVVVGSSGVGQRFIFSLDIQNASPEAARLAIPGARWEVADLEIPQQSPVPVQVSPDTGPGGGIGPNTGGISLTGVPLDEIERLIGMPLSQIDWSQITDEQIRSFGYDPTEVRKYIAQYKLQLTQLGGGATGSSPGGCKSTDPLITAIESQLGVNIAQIDMSKITDDQIKKYGYEPAQVRAAIDKAKQSASSNDCAGNVFTQEGFAGGSVDPKTIPSGAVANVTAQTTFDLLKGGWIIKLRWQAPGGAKRFLIYGRDNGKNTHEQKLAALDGDQREANFGGFKRLALPLWHDQDYWLSVVPLQSDGALGTPSAVKTNIKCYVVWCSASPPK